MADENLSVSQDGATTSVQHDGSPTPPVEPQAQRPEGLPEGFESWEEFGKAQLAGKEEVQEEVPQQEALSEEVQKEVNAAVESLPEGNRDKARPFFEEFARAGDLTAESRKAAAEAFGVSEEMVDLYVKGAQSQNAQAEADLYEASGVSQADADAFKEFAEANFSAEEKAAFNKGLDKDAAQTLKDAVAKWKAEGNGAPPRDVTKDVPSSRSNTSAVDAYESVAEMSRDMNDPRYGKDPAFRAKVEKRIAASDLNISQSY